MPEKFKSRVPRAFVQKVVFYMKVNAHKPVFNNQFSSSEKRRHIIAN